MGDLTRCKSNTHTGEIATGGRKGNHFPEASKMMFSTNCSSVFSPRVIGGQVLYLDFDGVLHHEDVCLNTKRGLFFGSNAQAHGARHDHTHRLFEHAPLLAELLAPYPDVQIVLSTSWVRWRGYAHARDSLIPELARRCVGATFHKHMNRDTFQQLSRGFQIWLDVKRRMPSTWLAIDDDHSDWPDWCQDRLVRSDDDWGISQPEVLFALKAALAMAFGRNQLQQAFSKKSGPGTGT